MTIEEEKIVFYEPLFLQNNPLNPETVMDYFSMSPFYDRESINEILKMQSTFTKIDIKEHLNRIEGIFYELNESESIIEKDLYVISKNENINGSVTLLKAYYVMFGYIYTCPSVDLYSDTKMIDILSRMNSMLDLYESNKRIDFIRGVTLKREKENPQEDKMDMGFFIETMREFVYENRPKTK